MTTNDATRRALSRNGVYMLAGDHRWQWDEWCDANGVARAKIPGVKSVIADAFLAARRQSADVSRHGALLLDAQYAGDVIARAMAEGVTVGSPAEKAGAFPLEWPDSAFEARVPGAFAKVLIKDRPDYEPAVRAGQIEKLLELQQWCRANGRQLLVEVLVPRVNEPEGEFEEHGRPAALAAAIRDAYARGLTPDFWKIEGTTSSAGARIVDDAIAERDGCRLIILGKNADPVQIGRWFATAAACRTASGFAIGRSVFWKPGTAYLLGTMTASAAEEAMTATYLSLVAAWNGAAAAARA
jgi:myo-inositol catabolism protein IolC